MTVTKSDYEEGTAQGDATLAGAVYGIYKGDTLIDEYVTDENGQFTTKEYICDTDWTIREIKPSEGYLLDDTVHAVGADPKLYTVEHIVYNYKGYGLPCFETIRRARQRVQSLFPELSRQCTGCCCDVPDKLKIVIEVR